MKTQKIYLLVMRVIFTLLLMMVITANVHAEDDYMIPEGDLVYETSLILTDYAFEDWGQYATIVLFGEEYVPLTDGSGSFNAGKLAKLLIDDNTIHNLRSEEVLDLGNGYALKVVTVDLDGMKVWLELSMNGEYVDDVSISVPEEATGDGKFYLDIEDEDDVIVMRVHINSIFQGVYDSIVQIQGLWLIDFGNVFTVVEGDEFGELEVSNIGEEGLALQNSDNIILPRASSVEITQNMYLGVEDNDILRVYPFVKTGVESEIVSPVFSGANLDDILANEGGQIEFTGLNFPAFYHSTDDNTETLIIQDSGSTEGITIAEGDLIYEASPALKNYAYEDWGQYYITGFFCEEYIPLTNTYGSFNADKLAKLLIDSDDTYSLRSDEILDLGNGYTLKVEGIDVGGDKVLLNFTKDGAYVDDEVIDITSPEESTWVLDLDGIENENDIVVFKVFVDQITQEDGDDIVWINGLWLIDYANATTVGYDSEYGVFEVSSITSYSIELENDEEILLSRDSEVPIFDNLVFNVADSDDLNFYLMLKTSGSGVQGEIIEVDDVPFTWTYDNFPALYYDLNGNLFIETLSINNIVEYSPYSKFRRAYTDSLRSECPDEVQPRNQNSFNRHPADA